MESHLLHGFGGLGQPDRFAETAALLGFLGQFTKEDSPATKKHVKGLEDFLDPLPAVLTEPPSRQWLEEMARSVTNERFRPSTFLA